MGPSVELAASYTFDFPLDWQVCCCLHARARFDQSREGQPLCRPFYRLQVTPFVAHSVACRRVMLSRPDQ